MSALDLGVPKAAVAAAEVLMLLLVLGLPSCDWNAQESTHPLYTKKDVVSDDTIIGVWRIDAGAGFSATRPLGVFSVTQPPNGNQTDSTRSRRRPEPTTIC